MKSLCLFSAGWALIYRDKCFGKHVFFNGFGPKRESLQGGDCWLLLFGFAAREACIGCFLGISDKGAGNVYQLTFGSDMAHESGFKDINVIEPLLPDCRAQAIMGSGIVALSAGGIQSLGPVAKQSGVFSQESFDRMMRISGRNAPGGGIRDAFSSAIWTA